MRIGLGYDTHALVEGRPLFLGGVQIPHEKGLLGHSDGDCLLHAISDALLGAAGLPDIGFHFPDTDRSIAGIESRLILARSVELVKAEGYSVENVDAVVVCQAPKIMPHRDDIKAAIAAIMGIETGRVNVKGKTTEGLGFTGRKEGIEAYAVCLLSTSPGASRG